MDVAVSGGQIAAIARPGEITEDAAQVIDAQDHIVLPGGVEPHAHFNAEVPEVRTGRPHVHTQQPLTGSLAAAFGGTTTFVDFAMPAPMPGEPVPVPEIEADVEKRRREYSGHCYTDFAFHCTLFGDVLPGTLEQIGSAVQSGIASFKVYTINDPIRVPWGHLHAVFEHVAEAGGMMAVHAEDEDIVRYMKEKLWREGRGEGFNLPLAHNNLSEALAFQRVVSLARNTGAAIYFLHTTAKEGVEAIAEARADRLPVYGEALHNYLHFTMDDYQQPSGTAVHTYPSIKSADDRDALTDGLLDGRLATVATDDYTTPKDVKLFGDTIDTICGGHNGIETRIPVAFTKLVQERGMSLERFADVIATNAAKILGLYPRKGVIMPGSDADIVILDPNSNRTIALDDLHADCDYSIWEGFPCRGYPITTILRGKVIVDKGQLLGSPDDGQWQSRTVDSAILSGPAV
jgi:dihydropyrimidinase